RNGGMWRPDDPSRSPRPDGGAHAVSIAPPAHARGGGGHTRVRVAVRGGPGDVGHRGPAARLRLREIPQQRALADRRPSRLGRTAAAGAGPLRRAVPRDPRSRDVFGRAARHAARTDPVRGGRAVRVSGGVRAGASPRGPSRPVNGHAPDALGLAIDRAAGARAIGGNRLEHHPDSPRALEVMLELIAQARRWVHFENYIIRDDRTGRRFAAALAE